MFRTRGPAATEVDFGTITRQASLQSFVTASGEIVAERFADIGSSTMGRLVDLAVKEGDRVKVGQLLAQIDPVQARSSADAAAAALSALEAEARGAAEQVRASQADIAVAKARANEAQKASGASARTTQPGAHPALRARHRRGAGRGRRGAARRRHGGAAAHRAVQRQCRPAGRPGSRRAGRAPAISWTRPAITAPLDGVVTRLDVEEGEMVVIGVQNQPGSILMTVSDLECHQRRGQSGRGRRAPPSDG